MKYLFVCVHNAGRSQMAEAFFNDEVKKKNLKNISCLSAGTDPTEHINTVAVNAMKEIVIDLSKSSPKILTYDMIDSETKIITMGCNVNPEKINMLTFGFGSGIAGVAGVAIGLFSKVTSELGSEYIVQSFMTVVVGGVGSIWGTLAVASLIGFLQKFIEWFNPSNTLAAQTYMIIFIILFIQFRPKGLIALKGRAANDN